jgi:hypothetical protein
MGAKNIMIVGATGIVGGCALAAAWTWPKFRTSR